MADWNLSHCRVFSCFVSGVLVFFIKQDRGGSAGRLIHHLMTRADLGWPAVTAADELTFVWQKKKQNKTKASASRDSVQNRTATPGFWPPVGFVTNQSECIWFFFSANHYKIMRVAITRTFFFFLKRSHSANYEDFGCHRQIVLPAQALTMCLPAVGRTIIFRGKEYKC